MQVADLKESASVLLCSMNHALSMHGLPRRGDHLDSCYRRTFMLLKHVSVRVSSGKTYLPVRRCRAVTGRGSATRRNAMREREVVLPFTLRTGADALRGYVRGAYVAVTL